ncbi:cell division cycle protein 27 homolog [Uranotaenia lowii]|uniref:cell division cycle protein 27 homolog n=1 Tax=Uranotaenia lowii TaxID=190385 RepID=UPI00247907F8|nr:cell division cycle protein 27 homolog [Uranotaenia lowii]
MSKSPLSHAVTLFTKQEGIKVHQARSGIRGKSAPSGSEAEHILINDDHLRVRHLDEVTKEFGDIGCFALEMSSRICQKTERAALANDASRRAVKLNPFIRRKCFSFRAPIYFPLVSQRP